MPTVELSSALASSITQRMFQGVTTQTSVNSSNPLLTFTQKSWPFIPLFPEIYGTASTYTGTSVYNGVINIYKGAVPTDFSWSTTTSSRSTDMLVQWLSRSSELNFKYGSTYSATGATITSAYSTAFASGTATFFLLRTDSPYTINTSIQHQILGTVGAVGSGSDLEISSTNIVGGNSYRILNFKLKIPTTYTY